MSYFIFIFQNILFLVFIGKSSKGGMIYYWV